MDIRDIRLNSNSNSNDGRSNGMNVDIRSNNDIRNGVGVGGDMRNGDMRSGDGRSNMGGVGGNGVGVGGNGVGGGGGGGMMMITDDDEAWKRPTPYSERRRAGKHTRRVIVKNT
ncbi:hypothetical protein ONZ45_g17558 [Pleurotus djamor]|nr:hypothetical protein ONZ45_g17558 [Pleurotus djamor]